MSVKALKRQLLAAIAMVLVCTIALGSSTFAWFSMNTAVSATGMKVTAQAESGIVISNSATSDWKSTAATTTDAMTLLPTSTSNGTTWYHSTSSDANDANAANSQSLTNPYTTVSNNATSKTYYYSENVFWIKSATANDVACSSNLYIKSVTATSSTTSSQNLDKSLRVGVLVGSDTKLYIFAPVSGATSEYTVNGNSSLKVTAIDSSASSTTPIDTATAITSVPATDNGLKVTVFVWYEGEDANCVSNNVTATLDQLEVSVQFSTAKSTT